MSGHLLRDRRMHLITGIRYGRGFVEVHGPACRDVLRVGDVLWWRHVSTGDRERIICTERYGAPYMIGTMVRHWPTSCDGTAKPPAGDGT